MDGVVVKLVFFRGKKVFDIVESNEWEFFDEDLRSSVSRSFLLLLLLLLFFHHGLISRSP